MSFRRLAPIGLFLVAGSIWFWPLLTNPESVLFWREGQYSDLLISHWPNAEYVQRSLTEWGQLPLWNPLILSGAPLAADPLAGLWYPPNWLAFVIHPALAYHLLLWLHLAWAGLGAWRLGRTLGGSNHAALVAGLAFAASPKLVGHIGLGHVSLIFAVSWTPWVLIATDRAAGAVRLSGRAWARSAALAGVASGLVFLADPRWYPPTVALGTAYFVWRFAHSHHHTLDGADRAAGRPGAPVLGSQLLASWKVILGSGLVAAGSSLGSAAVLALPLVEFVGLSTRASLDPAEAAASALPASRTLSLLAPRIAEWPEWQLYPGIVVMLLAIVGVVTRGSGRWFWVVVAVVGVLTAMGDATPFFHGLRLALPGFAQLRVPPRVLFLSGLALAVLAARGFDRSERPQIRIVGLALLVVVGLLGLATWLSTIGEPQDARVLRIAPWIVSAALLSLAILWSRTPSGNRSFAGWILIILLDLGLTNTLTLQARALTQDLRVEQVSAQVPTHQRVFSPSYSLPQPSAARVGLELADGVNPLMLATYRDFMVGAAGVDPVQYSVTLPPFPDGDVSAEWGFKPEPEKLGLLGVSHMVAAYPILNEQLEYLGRIEGHYLYANPLARPRAWMDGTPGVEEFTWSPNHIAVRTRGPGRLVLAEISYPGWVATVDGEHTAIEEYRGALRSVVLSPGRHLVVFEFRPASLQAGGVISLLTLLILLTLWIRK